MADEETPETPEEQPAASAEQDATPTEETPQSAAPAEEAAPAEAPAAEEPAAAPAPAAEPAPVAEQAPAAAAAEPAEEEEQEAAPREKPAVPGAHLEVDIVPEGVDPLGRSQSYGGESYTEDPYASDEDGEQPTAGEEDSEEALSEPISTAAIDLAKGARYRATGKRKTAIARVTLRPGTGTYLINGKTLEEHFPRLTLQRNIRQPLETVGYQERMDVVARLHGGGISAQAGALRHGVSRALLEADPNLRGELKRRGFLTRDSRAKERKKAGLKKARKKPQFSKR
jgi:small subunit ribosomal protein S9